MFGRETNDEGILSHGVDRLFVHVSRLFGLFHIGFELRCKIRCGLEIIFLCLHDNLLRRQSPKNGCAVFTLHNGSVCPDKSGLVSFDCKSQRIIFYFAIENLCNVGKDCHLFPDKRVIVKRQVSVFHIETIVHSL